MEDYINSRENLKIKPIDSSLKNKCIAHCPELPFGILSFSSYVDIEAMNIIFSELEINVYKLFGVKSNKLVKACVRYFSLFLKVKCISSLLRTKYIEKKFDLQLLSLPIVS